MCRPVGCRPVGESPTCLSPRWFVAQMTGDPFNDLDWPLTGISRSRYFSTSNIPETTRDRAIYYRKSIGSHRLSIEWWHFQWPWRTPNTFFKVTAYLKSNISILWTKLLKNTNRKPYTVYRTVPFLMTFVLWPGFQGHDSFRHWISRKRHEIEP